MECGHINCWWYSIVHSWVPRFFLSAWRDLDSGEQVSTQFWQVWTIVGFKAPQLWSFSIISTCSIRDLKVLLDSRFLLEEQVTAIALGAFAYCSFVLYTSCVHFSTWKWKEETANCSLPRKLEGLDQELDITEQKKIGHNWTEEKDVLYTTALLCSDHLQFWMLHSKLQVIRS